jgi:hypothetical protein
MARFLIAVMHITLPHHPAMYKNEVKDVLKANNSILHFYIHCQYPRHTAHTVAKMENALKRFHTAKAVFLRFRADRSNKTSARTLRKELVAERDEELNLARNAAEKKKLFEDWNLYINSTFRLHLEQNAGFNFPKMHPVNHFPEQVTCFGSLVQFSTDIGESLHRLIKKAYRKSNRTGDIDKQVIDNWARKSAFDMRQLNIVFHETHNAALSSDGRSPQMEE